MKHKMTNQIDIVKKSYVNGEIPADKFCYVNESLEYAAVYEGSLQRCTYHTLYRVVNDVVETFEQEVFENRFLGYWNKL